MLLVTVNDCHLCVNKNPSTLRGALLPEPFRLGEALLVIIHHLAPQAILDRVHLTNRDDLAALLTYVLRRHEGLLGFLFGLLTGLRHRCAPFDAHLRRLKSRR